MGVEMKSTDFRSKDYYTNIRKAVTAGYFMQVCPCALPLKCVRKLFCLVAEKLLKHLQLKVHVEQPLFSYFDVSAT